MTHAMSWDGVCLTPTPQALRSCQERFSPGTVYAVEAIDERSHAAHARFFARINELWQNLPEIMQHDYPSSEHLRKRALIETGYATEQVHTCQTKAEAQRFAKLIRTREEFSIVIVSGDVIRIFAPMSQSFAEMGSKKFYQSAEAVEGWILALIDSAYKEVAE